MNKESESGVYLTLSLEYENEFRKTYNEKYQFCRDGIVTKFYDTVEEYLIFLYNSNSGLKEECRTVIESLSDIKDLEYKSIPVETLEFTLNEIKRINKIYLASNNQ